jgi:protoporphyrin/coproporphyrin ferrochelatase
MSYLGAAQHEHGGPAPLGVLLANLGTPTAATSAAVRKFLAEFLWDPRVIEQPRWLWWLALHGVILRIRPPRSARAYRQIWTPQGSPLLVHSRALLEETRKSLLTTLGPNVAIVLGMTYGEPSIAGALEQLRSAGVQRLVVLPLYPQYSGSSTAPVFDRVTSLLQRWRWVPELRFINHYHDDPGYIAALADTIRRHWQSNERRHLLFSFHGVPKRYLLAGDPYHCQCLKTARLVSEQLSLSADEWSVGFQSRFAREEWLQPYTEDLLTEFAKGNRKRLTVICPGFATDCLETLEEIAIRNRELFLAAGGEAYDYIPALNAEPAHATLLTHLIAAHAQGWQSTGARDADTKERALRYGAAR